MKKSRLPILSMSHLVGILIGIALAIAVLCALFGQGILNATLSSGSGSQAAQVLQVMPSLSTTSPVTSPRSEVNVLNKVLKETATSSSHAGTPHVPGRTFPLESAERSHVPTTAATSTPERVQVMIKQMSEVLKTYETKNTAVDVTKERLTSIVEESASHALITVDPPDVSQKNAAIHATQEELVQKINTRLDVPVRVTPVTVEQLKAEVTEGLEGIRQTAPGMVPAAESRMALQELIQTIATSSQAFREKGGDLLFKDSNDDGISDYDSVHVYSLDPVKPSPLSEYNGRSITAGERIALGFDPTQAVLKRVYPEEPEMVEIPAANAYTVKAVALTEDKKVTFEGRALPNSFITLFIYSTPIVVTIKTDENGDWRYTLEKELEDGSHTISTATVDNSGRILAKSTAYPFTKTAQAATLDSAIPVPGATTTEQPSLFTPTNIYLLLGILTTLFLLTLLLIGLRVRRNGAKPLDPEGIPPVA